MTVNDTSILTSMKKMLDIGPSDDSFDDNIVVEINTVFSQLFQLGVGPQTDAFYIEDDTAKWQDFIGDTSTILMVKTYMKDSIRMSWDPPATGYALDAMQKRIEKFEWRLQVAAEESRKAAETITLVTPDPSDTPEPFVTYFTGDNNG